MGKHSSPRKHAVKSIVERLKKVTPTGKAAEEGSGSKLEVGLGLAAVSEIYSVLGLEWPPTSKPTPPQNETPTPLASFARRARQKVTHSIEAVSSSLRARKPSKSNLSCAFFTILALIFYFELHTLGGFTRFWLRAGSDPLDLRSTECTIEHSHWAMELFRPATSCDFCTGVQAADRVSSIAPHDFELKYAYSGRPVIVTDAMRNWTATRSFSFEFLKSIYGEGSRSLEHDGENCLFFPYSTEFRSLGQVFNMSETRRTTQHWYIGWSNCDAEASHILRQHYQRPYFLPETAESTHADWLFMGTPGYGAHMHIDHVFLPSWQAQVSGSKRWFLQPPPECYFQCTSFSVDVAAGEIIVLDTNKWYHQTLILPGDMSITIGSEYD